MEIEKTTHEVKLNEWEAAWSKYVQKLKRLEELKNMGRYGYQLRQPRKAIDLAIIKLRKIDPEFCKQVGI